MTFTYPKLSAAILTLIVLISSCTKNEIQPPADLFDPQLKNLELNTGFTDNGIPIHAEAWSVEYVKDGISGETLATADGQAMVLEGYGSIELPNGLLKLEKKEKGNLLNITLKENLSSEPRKFLIGILADGRQDELSFTQTRGEGYTIVEKDITEVPGSRKVYTSDEGCYTITLTNNSSTAKDMETTEIFKDVKYMSEFSSEDINAFDWVNDQDTLIFMDEVIIDDAIWWSDQVYYKKGQSSKSYIEKGNKEELLVQPYSSINVRGRMNYLERECLYSFTIENLSSGHRFEISGTWKQKIPISPITETF